MTNYLLFIDTETSGIPRKWNSPKENQKDWPYILQISWIIYTQLGSHVKTENHYINTGNIKINKESQRIHGITLELLKEVGKERKDVINLLKSDLLEFQPMVIGHFLEFDHKMLDVGFHRAGIENIVKNLSHFCTMKVTFNLDFMNPGRYLRLPELYKYLFKKEQMNQHDAKCDAQATADCFFELVKRGVINEKTIEKQQIQSKGWNILSLPVRSLFIFLGILILLLILLYILKFS